LSAEPRPPCSTLASRRQGRGVQKRRALHRHCPAKVDDGTVIRTAGDLRTAGAGAMLVGLLASLLRVEARDLVVGRSTSDGFPINVIQADVQGQSHRESDRVRHSPSTPIRFSQNSDCSSSGAGSSLGAGLAAAFTGLCSTRGAGFGSSSNFQILCFAGPWHSGPQDFFASTCAPAHVHSSRYVNRS